MREEIKSVVKIIIKLMYQDYHVCRNLPMLALLYHIEQCSLEVILDFGEQKNASANSGMLETILFTLKLTFFVFSRIKNNSKVRNYKRTHRYLVIKTNLPIKGFGVVIVQPVIQR